ncbi:DUF3696 domain-containing protein [Clostridium beijerinckii]|uniref:DUF3696 domain-containing protein n=1 Tax=Clostridium beijerinckii TaxID=1520 RepID=UPI002431F461|nr:DUF3696 domain-containing protein [Clostridium beijerinckii]MDG5854387.1 DUF3696 domain-containing protein [Clostridium beijerinckii]
MINKFELKDFKGHEDWNSFDLNGLTVLTGTNNSGKTSIMQGIYLLTQHETWTVPILNLNRHLELGEFSDVLNKEKSIDESIDFAISFDHDVLSEKNFDYLSVQLVYKDSKILSTNYYNTGIPILTNVNINYKKENEKGKMLKLQLSEDNSEVLYEIISDTDSGFCKINGIKPESLIYTDIEKSNRVIASQDFETIAAFIELISINKIKYLRSDNNAESNEEGRLNSDWIGTFGSFTAEVLYKRLNTSVDFFKENETNYSFVELFDQWVKKILGNQYTIRVEKPENKYKVYVMDNESHNKLELKHVGFGISQLLPIFVMILTSKKNDLLLIQNPEIHLHPKLQADLVELLVFVVENGRKLVVETHSEHIINRIRLLIKNNNNINKFVRVYFLDKIEGEIQTQEINIDEKGKIDYWPKHFFDQTYQDYIGLIKNDSVF